MFSLQRWIHTPTLYPSWIVRHVRSNLNVLIWLTKFSLDWKCGPPEVRKNHRQRKKKLLGYYWSVSFQIFTRTLKKQNIFSPFVFKCQIERHLFVWLQQEVEVFSHEIQMLLSDLLWFMEALLIQDEFMFVYSFVLPMKDNKLIQSNKMGLFWIRVCLFLLVFFY